ncbi:ELM1/GtrOC1 family putative glycosyltransferase [Piscinibacter koreensis]|uniref:Mitochondrial fission ELM1 family protein n=1 Tax=Piscinibacter koreensis TaxID=2742824 RepID=A0A7Y6NQA9_9BURK|nr:ELM1/GtrOC1 family putative glycosyltransferase [Schlegelella koreensis]NUZ07366.1 mitochondrial fission ELM1 family protein [Schlegelella koreensis]
MSVALSPRTIERTGTGAGQGPKQPDARPAPEPPAIGETAVAPVWAMTADRVGDARQVLALAGELGVAFRTVRLRFNALARVPPAHWLPSRMSWRSDVPLEAPWPKLVIVAGRKSAAAALWVKRRSGGRTRIVSVHRPWTPLAWWDLVVTTPQYALPARDNVLECLLPLLASGPTEAALGARWAADAAALPRPWTVVLVGGDSRPHVLTQRAARRVADAVNARLQSRGGSAWVLTSPRTPPSALACLRGAMEGPHRIVPWGEPDNPYPALRGAADEFVVTADSAAMLAEALVSGKPVTPVLTDFVPDWRWRVASACKRAAERAPGSIVARGFESAVATGLVTSVRDMSRMLEAHQRAGLYDDPAQAARVQAHERGRVVARLRALLGN